MAVKNILIGRRPLIEDIPDAFDDDEDDISNFQKEMRIADPAMIEEFLYSNWPFHRDDRMWVIVEYSDFTGRAADRSNSLYLLTKYPGIVTATGRKQFGTVKTGIALENLEKIDTTVVESLMHDAETLQKTDILDDKLYQEERRKKIEEAWDTWVKGYFFSDVVLKFRGRVEGIAGISANRLHGLFEEARDASGEEWYQWQGGEQTVGVNRIVNAVTNEMLQRWVAAPDDMQVESLLLEHKFSCVMAPAPADLSDAVIGWSKMFITEDKLYIDSEDHEGSGRETEIHVTIKYGLHEGRPSKELLRIFEETQPFEIEIGPASLFENDEFDVVKFDVESEALRELNRRVSELPCTDTYPDYHPHLTVAYVIKGVCRDLIDKPLLDPEPDIPPRFLVKSVIFSSKDDKKTVLLLGQSNPQSEPANLDEAVPKRINVDKIKQKTRLYQVVPRGDDPLKYEFCEGKFYLSPDLRWIAVDDHEQGARAILGKNGLPRDPVDMNPNQARLEGDYRFLRVINYETQIYFSPFPGRPASAGQLRELRNLAIETRSQLFLDDLAHGKVLYDPDNPMVGESADPSKKSIFEDFREHWKRGKAINEDEQPDEDEQMDTETAKEMHDTEGPKFKNFTDTDVESYGTYDRIFATREELIRAPTKWQKQGLTQTASGYGAKLNTGLKISFNGRLYRLYSTCYGNAGSVWFKVAGRKIYVS